VQTNILEKYPDSDLKVYAIWFEMLSGDARDTWDPAVLSDDRVRHFWDARGAAGRWYSKHVYGEDGIAWDVYFLYGPDAEWQSTPPPLISTGGDIISTTEPLAADVARLLNR
jgi:hypothetical protein